MPQFSRSRRTTLTYAAALAAPFAVHGQAATEIQLGWTTGPKPPDPYATGAVKFQEALKQSTGGRMVVKLAPNRELGDEAQMLEGMQTGAVDAGIITNAVIAKIEPAFQVNDLPFLFLSERDAHDALDGQLGRKLSAMLEQKGIKLLGFMEGGFRNMVNNKRAVRTPSDVKGVAYRVMQNPMFVDMFNALGGRPVPIPWGDTFNAMKEGRVDGLEIPLTVIDQSKYYEIAKYLSLTNHVYSAIGLLISRKKFDGLSSQQQKNVAQAAREAIVQQRIASRAAGTLLLFELQKKGMEINLVSSPSSFRSSVAPLYDAYRRTFGNELLELALKRG